MRLMHKIAYAGTVFYTGDRIATALLEYAAALARAGSAVAFTVPARTSDGELTRIEVLIGPASQLASEPVGDTGWPEIEDDDAVAELERSATALAPPAPTFDRPYPDDEWDGVEGVGR